MRASHFTALAAAAVCAISLAACGTDKSAERESQAGAAAPTTSASVPAAAVPSAAVPSAAVSVAAGGSATFGAGCAALPADAANPGSLSAMAKVPVATAAAANPQLSTLVTAVNQAGLADTLNAAEDITVFAPVNDAFTKVPPATLNQVLADKKTLTGVLNYHIVAGRLTPDELAGSHKTLQGQSLTVTGRGESFKVGGTAQIVCGNVQTANATVYLIDAVLLPKS